MENTVTITMTGALVALACVAGLFFLRFYVETRDRLFLFFSGAFFLLGVDWLLSSLLGRLKETAPELYLVRLAAFLIIIYGVVDKNRRPAVGGGAGREGGDGELGKSPPRAAS